MTVVVVVVVVAVKRRRSQSLPFLLFSDEVFHGTPPLLGRLVL